MRIGPILVITGGLAYLAYKLFNAAGAAMGLSVSVKGIKYGGTDLSKTWFFVDLGIINPSVQTFSFTRFFGQLRFNGQILASVTKEGVGEGIVIQPAAETVITVPVYINHLSTALSSIEIVKKFLNKEPVEGLAFNGVLYAGGFAVPVSQTLNLNFSQNAIKGFNCKPCATGKLSGVLN